MGQQSQRSVCSVRRVRVVFGGGEWGGGRGYEKPNFLVPTTAATMTDCARPVPAATPSLLSPLLVQHFTIVFVTQLEHCQSQSHPRRAAPRRTAPRRAAREWCRDDFDQFQHP